MTLHLRCCLCERGVDYVPPPRWHGNRPKLCPYCRDVVKHKQWRDGRRRQYAKTKKAEDRVSYGALTRGEYCYAMVCAGMHGCPAGLGCARKKPRHVSAVRWRIELARRRNPGYYDSLPEVLP